LNGLSVERTIPACFFYLHNPKNQVIGDDYGIFNKKQDKKQRKTEIARNRQKSPAHLKGAFKKLSNFKTNFKKKKTELNFFLHILKVRLFSITLGYTTYISEMKTHFYAPG
jgi:hypothetical protein